eukprot:gene2432-biopygen970
MAGQREAHAADGRSWQRASPLIQRSAGSSFTVRVERLARGGRREQQSDGGAHRDTERRARGVRAARAARAVAGGSRSVQLRGLQPQHALPRRRMVAEAGSCWRGSGVACAGAAAGL